jgi:UDP-N-acetylglucosamine/UDP-N-acetylgalactosamine diphosphorylase
MTSPANDRQTREFFDQHGCFGLRPDRVKFFQQGVMPAFDRCGKMLLDQPHRLALSPDGHGGTLLALAARGMLADMARRGIDYISYFQVDNPLVACIDPLFVGAHAESGSEASSKSLPKADDFEKVGHFATADGKLTVIEYSDLPEDLALARNADGSRRFDAANIAVHLFDRAFIERLTADRAAFGLPWHRALKKVPHVDLDSGRRVEPGAADAVKLEAFIFDALPLARRPLLLETSRAEEFSPIKNATGVDSVDSARRDMSRRAARWLAQAGFDVPRRADGEPDGVFEISPLLATTAEELRSRTLSPRPIAPNERVYLE